MTGRILLALFLVGVATAGDANTLLNAESKAVVQPDFKQPLGPDWTGDRMAARLDGHVLQAQHPCLATVKARWWFAVSGATAQLRNVRAWEGLPLPVK